MTLYSGKCEGGPFDGLPMHHGEPDHKIGVSGMRAQLWVGPETDAIRYGWYRHREGRWLWEPPK